jgi:predicted nucleic acid-binding protein
LPPRVLAMRVFLDANSLFSAARTDGAVRALLRLMLERGHGLVVDAVVIAEAQRHLQAKGPQALQVLDALLPRLVVGAAATVAAVAPADIAWLPDKDRPVLAAVIRLSCDVLVTGDRTPFGSGDGRSFRGVTIHSPRSLAERGLTDG